jgi:hypothetical protein
MSEGITKQEDMHGHGHAVTFFGGEGIITQEDFADYFDIIQGAFAVYIGRERVRRALWKEYPAKDQFNQIRIKIDRVMRTLEVIAAAGADDNITALKAEIESEAYDIINYATFGVRQL